MKPATHIIQRSTGITDDAHPLTTPIFETTTFVFDSADQVKEHAEGRSHKYLYSRYANPTVAAVEQKIAALEKAESALVLSSGQGATATALLALTQSGDEIVCSAAIYGGTLHLLSDLLPRFGLSARFVSLAELARPESIIGERTKLVWFESPINPTLRCVDVAAVAAACRARGVISVIDNTFASPINQQPIELGVDLVMHSATKYLNGHSDVTAGVLAGPARLLDPILKARKLLGTVLDPYAAYALGRGLKTLAVRMDRHNTNAAAVARWLAADPRVKTVYYPGLETHPDHAIARKQMRGFGGMICVDVGGGYAGAARFFDRLTVFNRAASLGGVESLCSLPVLTSQWGHSDAELAAAGVTQSMARLSVGLEDADDLIADLDQALGS
ncbi:MAG: aminotransferase class I/II-fold pyridoxal phosphate-dependent enzyme [Acidobacteria bacterium]|nr:aminotransferase class I/II-fold pyridoxal phosphate-dependent enzyme [Acidobacteriota bacterium]MCA1649215.1 aminotransferase class I/II-fold pyridoxal phosphate-dependent enzyme [Acidobacteriota bacterium]